MRIDVLYLWGKKNGLLLVIILIFLVVLFFVNLPKYIETTARIVSVKSKHERVGIREYIKFNFVVEDELYQGTIKTWRNYKYKKQFIGNTLELRYSIANPDHNKFIKFNNEYSSENNRIVLFDKQNGNIALTLVNNVFDFKEYREGKIVNEEKGLFSQKADTIIMKPFLRKSFLVSFLEKNKRWGDFDGHEYFTQLSQ